MTSVRIYGIKNCDTMKKAFQWLEQHKIAYDFHDYKKSGIDAEILEKAIEQHGWENVINRKGTSWRALSDTEKESMNAAKAVKAAQNNPSLVRRPMLSCKTGLYLGFSEKDYAALFKAA